MANFLGNFVSLMGVLVFYFQNLVTLYMASHPKDDIPCSRCENLKSNTFNLDLGLLDNHDCQ
jgi:hypothetical protein